MKYKVGDKVKIVDTKEASHEWDDHGKMYRYLGKTMTIRSVGSDSYRMNEDDGEWMGSGWYWYEEMIAGLACEQKIVITSDGVTTLARLYEGSKVVKSAEAKCSADDEFKFETGAKLAMERLYTPEPKPKFKEGDWVRIIGNDEPLCGIYHNYDIGDVVRVIRVDSDHSYYCKRPYDKLEQYVSAKHVENPEK